MDSILDFYLGKRVIIQTRELSIQGKLVACQTNNQPTHRPQILILETPVAKVILRGDFISIREQVATKNPKIS